MITVAAIYITMALTAFVYLVFSDEVAQACSGCSRYEPFALRRVPFGIRFLILIVFPVVLVAVFVMDTSELGKFLRDMWQVIVRGQRPQW